MKTKRRVLSVLSASRSYHCRWQWLVAATLVLGLPVDSRAAQKAAADPAAALDAEVARAERALQEEERQIAESHFRGALYHGWMLRGALALSDGDAKSARDAFARAAAAVVDNREALQSLALVDLQLGEGANALAILTRLAAASPRDAALRRLLAQALMASRQPLEAVQALEEAHAAAPDDLETTFALASGYLQTKKIGAAERLFAEVAKARPIPQTYVLIGRAYRDGREYDRARAALEKALAIDPRVRHAHYYLGTLGVRAEGILRVDEAIREFRRELALAPADRFMNERLGIALVEARREPEALPHLQVAAKHAGGTAVTFQYLGRAYLATGRAADAVTAFRRALALMPERADADQLGNLHYQLARALRASGNAKEADAEFATAETLSAARADTDRSQLARYMTGDGEEGAATIALDAGPLGAMPEAARGELRTRVNTALARVNLNLGVMHAQAERFARAAERFEEAAAIDPDFPQVQYSLGVAYFNAEQYARAVPALDRAVAADPGNRQARRMLAIASLNSGDFAKAASLLRDDPARETDPSLQFAYGMALVRGGKAAEAEAIFTQLLAGHRDSPELNVVVGQAHAEQGDYDEAVASLRRAVELKPDVADANASLGIIYLKQGKFPEAAQALRSELAAHPDNAKARFTLATVLDLDGQREAALTEVQAVLKARPDDADARYLFGKMLLARGSAADAAAQLERAARLAPEDANVHYQLALAYQKLGRAELAAQEFAAYQKLKDKRRGESR